ncbi:MAG: NAD(P)-dependent oxidoreductase [Bacteroidales bacterium]
MNQQIEEKTRPLVLITGSSGLIGTRLIELLQDEYQVVGLDKQGNPFPPEKAENIIFDITSKESIRQAFRRIRYAYGNRIASVIHLAAYYDFSGEPSPLYEEVTVKGTEKLLRQLHEFEVEQFVFSSTNLIYKPTEPGKAINEEAPLEPNWEYPESKVNTEHVISQRRGEIPVVILRMAGAYDESGNSIPLAHQIQRIYEKTLTSHLYSGDKTHGNVFIHLDDMLDAFVKAVKRRKELPPEAIINIGEPETPSYQELQDKIGNLLYGKDWQTIMVPRPIAKTGAWAQTKTGIGDTFIKPWMIDRAEDHYELDISRARELLGWEPQHRLMDTLPAMTDRLKQDPLAWYQNNNLDPSGLDQDQK